MKKKINLYVLAAMIGLVVFWYTVQ